VKLRSPVRSQNNEMSAKCVLDLQTVEMKSSEVLSTINSRNAQESDIEWTL
ncbi:hypothetical protein BgiBS90_025291, partial [Biomphalaria glabrata]